MRGDLICVYRHRNAGLVQEIALQALSARLEPRLWALDEVAPELSDWTFGSGPGPRLALLNMLLDGASRKGFLVVSDDDVSFDQGNFSELLRLVRRSGLLLGQPAHAPGSVVNHGVTVQRPGSVTRLTRFVEVGPLVVVAERLRGRVTPFPEEFGMGWGLDIVWSDLRGRGCRLGIVDAVTIKHHGATAVEYDTEASERVIADLLAQRSIPSMGYFDATIRSWKVGRPLPVWMIPGLSWFGERRIPKFLRRTVKVLRGLAGTGEGAA